ncbi:hypothetical protein C8R45DRAFT_1130626 [Mycena sanguinolenta]|nr:hypothetical protein C8R45DRAFT_1130626 [Mycena sanguinolenta]
MLTADIWEIRHCPHWDPTSAQPLSGVRTLALTFVCPAPVLPVPDSDLTFRCQVDDLSTYLSVFLVASGLRCKCTDKLVLYARTLRTEKHAQVAAQTGPENGFQFSGAKGVSGWRPTAGSIQLTTKLQNSILAMSSANLGWRYLEADSMLLIHTTTSFDIVWVFRDKIFGFTSSSGDGSGNFSGSVLVEEIQILCAARFFSARPASSLRRSIPLPKERLTPFRIHAKSPSEPDNGDIVLGRSLKQRRGVFQGVHRGLLRERINAPLHVYLIHQACRFGFVSPARQQPPVPGLRYRNSVRHAWDAFFPTVGDVDGGFVSLRPLMVNWLAIAASIGIRGCQLEYGRIVGYNFGNWQTVELKKQSVEKFPGRVRRGKFNIKVYSFQLLQYVSPASFPLVFTDSWSLAIVFDAFLCSGAQCSTWVSSGHLSDRVDSFRKKINSKCAHTRLFAATVKKAVPRTMVRSKARRRVGTYVAYKDTGLKVEYRRTQRRFEVVPRAVKQVLIGPEVLRRARKISCCEPSAVVPIASQESERTRKCATSKMGTWSDACNIFSIHPVLKNGAPTKRDTNMVRRTTISSKSIEQGMRVQEIHDQWRSQAARRNFSIPSTAAACPSARACPASSTSHNERYNHEGQRLLLLSRPGIAFPPPRQLNICTSNCQLLVLSFWDVFLVFAVSLITRWRFAMPGNTEELLISNFPVNLKIATNLTKELFPAAKQYTPKRTRHPRTSYSDPRASKFHSRAPRITAA